jgi:hypothetical protein
MLIRLLRPVFPAVLAFYWPFCTPELRPTQPSELVRLEELWERPADVASSDLFHGPWGQEYAPRPDAPYQFVKTKVGGMNPGMTVTDPQGRKWHVKQASYEPDSGDEGPVEVTLSRVLSAVGYHQPPVYYLPSFTMRDAFGSRTEPGGRFRLDHHALKDRGHWSWQQNPFVGTRPYQGLLVILMMFNSSDLKNSNNTVYEMRAVHPGPRRWFVVRDLGMALGNTGRLRATRGSPALFVREAFVIGVDNGFVTFNYRGWHQELIRQRITVDDVLWASTLLGQLSTRQWEDAFRAGGYDTGTGSRFIRRLKDKITEGRSLGARSAGG